MQGNRHGSLFLHLLLAAVFVALRLGAVGGQNCDAIFEGRGFSVTQAALDEVKDDFQKLVDCVPDQGKLSIEPGLNIKPSTTVVVKNAIEVTSTGKGEKRPVLTCPDVGEPLFEISSTGVELKNFVVSDCMTDSNVTSAIVVDIEKDEDNETTSLEITGVDFVDNTNLNGTASIFIKSVESLSLTRVAFSANLGAHGGGVFLDSPGMEVKVKDCVFEENQSIYFGDTMEGRGAALFQNMSAFVTVTGSRFLNNYAENAGGAMYILGEPPASTLTITNTEFFNNTAGALKAEVDKDGGAIWAKGPTFELNIKNCTMVENKATGQGGVIFLLTSRRQGQIKTEIEDTVFEKNIAFVGGAIWARAAIQWRLGLSISNSQFLSNEALLQFVEPGSIFENAAQFPFIDPGQGGAITCIGISVDFISKGNRFEKNTAIGLGGVDQRGAKGGAILIADAENVTITNNVFKKNSAVNLDTLGEEASGGAIHLTAVGIETARVSDSPPGSPCELQCNADSDVPTLGISNAKAGCGVLDSGNQFRTCVLTNVTECEGVIPDENLVDFKDRPEFGARCKIIVINSNVRLSDTKFVENTADGFGGAVFATEEGNTLTLGKGVEFLRNTARNSRGGALAISEGATLVAEEGMIVKDNVAGLDGGGIVLQGTAGNLTLQGASFTGNMAEMGIGGAIASVSVGSNIAITGQGTFRNNEAAEAGGAIGCLSEDSNITMSDVTFVNNDAGLAGGALHAKSPRGKVGINLVDVAFSKNRIKSAPGMPLLGKGGAIALEGAAITLSISGKANTFADNSAREGGAVRLFDTQKADISQASFTNNVALSGGGLHASFTKKSRDIAVNITNVDFTGNKGYMGGGVMADARSANLSFVPDDGLTGAVFLPSTASQRPQVSFNEVQFNNQQVIKDGGGIFLIDIHAVGQNCDFEGNRVAVEFDGGGGAVKLADFASFDLTSGRFTGNRAVDGGAVFVSNSFFTGKDLNFKKNTALGRGGSIAVEGSSSGDATMVNLVDSKINENIAEFGGGIFANVLESEGINDVCQSVDDLSIEIEEFAFVQNVLAESCRNQQQFSMAASLSVILNSTLISNNKANRAGGGIFTGDPTLLCACCGSKCTSSCQSLGVESELELEGACAKSWVGNSHGSGGYGPIMASFASSGEIIKSDGHPLQDNEVLDEAHSSGEPMASLTVRMKDYFDQVVTVTRPNVFARVTSESSGGQILSGQVDTLVVRGVADFNATIVSAFPAEYQMRMSFPGIEVEDIPFRVTVRECVRGENPVEGLFSTSFSCRQCEANSFSFRPSQSCTSCPTFTTCDTRTLTPIDGYWHSSSWSQSIHKCLVDIACSYGSRFDKLKNQSEDSGAEPLHFGNNTAYKLCRTGYEGPLCGSCGKGYGRVRAFECQECLSKLKAIPLMIVMVLWIVIIVGFIIRNALKAGTPAKARVESRREEGPLESPGNHGPSQVIYLGVNPATENAKILINFLQITSIALVINVEWREEVRRALQIGDIASGFSANGGILSFDCPLEEDSVPVSIRRTILAVLLPLGMMVFPCFFLLRGYFNRTRARFFYRQAFVSVLVVAYVFYTGMTKRALRILHGVSVDSFESDTTFAHGRFWADDTKIRYFEGDHAYLATLLGLPVLLFYSFGFPGYLFYVLWGNKEKLNDESFARSYGFLYRAYHIKYVYWEIVIMARKALLVGVVVFIYELGGNLQSVFAVMVLMAALVLHLISQPYREELSQMNHRETLSLCVSVYTYLVGIAFNDSRLPAWSKIMLSVLLLVAIISLVIYLLCALAAESARHLKSVLEEREVTVPENATTWQKMRLLVNYYWFRVMDRFWQFTEHGIAWSRVKKRNQEPRV
ncbi:hypothetical protein BSKO_13521 [Bryopsis sp. KO-2023]|nr:hypothetical protein BSKO_13521 [Bryopsis sp. KO-2023]